MTTTQLGIFAKYWRPGAVKTRLAKTITAESASLVYKLFVETLLERMRGCADNCVLSVGPAADLHHFSELNVARWKIVDQGNGDLGRRMTRYFRDAFATGHRQVVLIGSDSPSLPREMIDKAFQLLERHDVVLGPSDDGGYYLVGMNRFQSAIFQGVEWSTDAVWQQTLAAAANSGIDVAELPEWFDVDDIDDLLRLQETLSTAPPASQLGQLKKLIGDILKDSPC